MRCQKSGSSPEPPIYSSSGERPGLDLNDGRHDHRLGADLFLDKAFEQDAEVFFEKAAVDDVLAFHFTDSVADRQAGVCQKSIRQVQTGDTLKRYLRITGKF